MYRWSWLGWGAVVIVAGGLTSAGCRGQGCAGGTCGRSSYNGPRYPTASSPPATLPAYGTSAGEDSPVPAYSTPLDFAPSGSGTRIPLQGSGSR